MMMLMMMMTTMTLSGLIAFVLDSIVFGSDTSVEVSVITFDVEAAAV